MEVQACLVLVEKRETRYRVMWYYRLFEETQRGLTRYPNSLEHIHGSLLALGELLRHTGAHMRPLEQQLLQIICGQQCPEKWHLQAPGGPGPAEVPFSARARAAVFVWGIQRRSVPFTDESLIFQPTMQESSCWLGTERWWR